MAERGVFVNHSTVHRWALNILPVLAKVLRQHKQLVARPGAVEEIHIKVNGQWKF